MFKCHECDETTVDEFTLEIHRLQTHQEPVSQCLLCNYIAHDIRWHIKSKHKDDWELAKELRDQKDLYEANLKCKFCDYIGLKASLIRHIESIHIVVMATCEKCGKTMKRTALYDHMINLHTDEENCYKYDCEDCNITFKHEKLLQRHLLTESHKKVVTKAIINLEEIKTMVDTIREQRNEGKKLTKNKTTTNATTNKSTNQPIDNQFSCEPCNTIFTSSSGLSKHINSIHKPPKHKCNVCQKLFKRSDTLQRHVRNVHNTVYIDCEYCNQTLCDREYYERHIKNCLLNNALHVYPGSSKWERMVSKYLVDNKIQFTFQKKYPDLTSENGIRLSYDFYINDLNLLIEINGKQHYEKTNYKDAKKIFERNLKHDVMKQEYAEEHDIGLMIIDTREFNTMEKIHDYLVECL